MEGSQNIFVEFVSIVLSLDFSICKIVGFIADSLFKQITNYCRNLNNFYSNFDPTVLVDLINDADFVH